MICNNVTRGQIHWSPTGWLRIIAEDNSRSPVLSGDEICAGEMGQNAERCVCRGGIPWRPMMDDRVWVV